MNKEEREFINELQGLDDLKEVKVRKLPTCDMCKSEGRQAVAKYDSRLFTTSTWAFMCEECYTSFGVPLGTGNAQKLTLIEKEGQSAEFIS